MLGRQQIREVDMTEMEGEHVVINEGVKKRKGKTSGSHSLVLSQLCLAYQASPDLGGKTCTHNALWLLTIRLG